METPVEEGGGPQAAFRPLPIVAGHLALDFANTVDDPNGPQRWDHIADYPALLAWCRRVGVLSGDDAAGLADLAGRRPRRAVAAVQQAAALRAAINELFGAMVDDRNPGGGWDKLRPFVVSALDHAELTTPATGRLTPTWRFVEPEAPLWPIAEAAYGLIRDRQLTRLKRCAGCPWLFLDYSKNHSRRWCSMEDCGTHEKIRRYVDKRAGRTGH